MLVYSEDMLEATSANRFTQGLAADLQLEEFEEYRIKFNEVAAKVRMHCCRHTLSDIPCSFFIFIKADFLRPRCLQLLYTC